MCWTLIASVACAASDWMRTHSVPCLYLAVCQIGGNMSELPQVFEGILGRPEYPSAVSWRQEAWLLYGAVNGFIPEDTGPFEPGNVSREDFEENLRAYNAGESDC